MIPIGARVRCKNEVRVEYGPGRPDDVVPPGSTGEVWYRPKDEDPNANFEIGVTWTRPDGTQCGIEVNEEEVDVLLDPKSFASIPPFDTHSALKRLLHYSWKDIAYEHAGLTPIEKASISPEEFKALKAWIAPKIGDKVRAIKRITEGGKGFEGDPSVASILGARAQDFIHAEAGEIGEVVHVNADSPDESSPFLPTVRFERTGTATIVDWTEIEW